MNKIHKTKTEYGSIGTLEPMTQEEIERQCEVVSSFAEIQEIVEREHLEDINFNPCK